MAGFRRNSGLIPERWLSCPRKANDLLENKFLAFKTPLDEKFNDQIPLENRFMPSIVFKSVKSYRQKLGLWIDLTRTNRFYDKNIITQNDCKYVKIECHGHEGAPNIEQVKTFISLCKLFISRDPLSIIGVHCTHGFNRTGFLLISFLVEVYYYNVEVAIHQFARVRPPGIYKEEYIKELYARYDDVNCAPMAPPLPSWYYEEKPISSDQIQKHGGRRKRNIRIKDPIFMDGVPGVDAVTDREKVYEVHAKIRELTGSEIDSFVGSQPVSMNKTNMTFLAEKPYRVSWKADGTRYMMFILNKDEVYFIDRDNSIFKINHLQFFLRKCNMQHITNTLLDGEMVIDKFKNTPIPRYLVYDIVYFEGKNIGKENFFPTRLRAIEKEIIEPRIEAMKAGRIIKEQEPFSVRAKSFYELHYTSYLLSEKFAKQLTHEPDGLIFQPSDDPYIYGTSNMVLKWKPLSLNSIDFKLQVRRVESMGCLPEYIGNLLTGNGQVFGKIKCNKNLRAFDNKIIECKYENNQWVFMRERTDKSFPNSNKTAQAVFESIRTPVTQSMLLEFIANQGWKDPMPPPIAPPPTKLRKTK
ncbi:hypothetical protein PGB90_007622 [Kerria lacca]